MAQTSKSASTDLVTLGVTQLHGTSLLRGRGRVHIFGRESRWGPISLCGHRIYIWQTLFRRDFNPDDFNLCGHCGRKSG